MKSNKAASGLKKFVASLQKLGVIREIDNSLSSNTASLASSGDLKSYGSPKIYIYDPESEKKKVRLP